MRRWLRLRLELSDRERELVEHVRRCTEAGCGHPIVYPTGDAYGFTLGWCQLCRALKTAEDRGWYRISHAD